MIGSDRIDIYDVLRPGFQTLSSYEASVSDDNENGPGNSSLSSYEAQHKAMFQPDRIVFINGVLQSRRMGEASFYELLVHPAMFSHSNPKTVAVIGFGDGVVLREILKHNTVERVIVIDYEEGLWNLIHQHLPQYHDCSSLVGGTTNCLDDPRRSITFYDTVAAAIANETNTVFDVIIMDDM